MHFDASKNWKKTQNLKINKNSAKKSREKCRKFKDIDIINLYIFKEKSSNTTTAPSRGRDRRKLIDIGEKSIYSFIVRKNVCYIKKYWKIERRL